MAKMITGFENVMKELDARKKGQFISVILDTDCEKDMAAAARKAGHTVHKISRTCVRKGIDITHQKEWIEDQEAKGLTVEEAREAYKSESHGLSWATYEKGKEGYILKHNTTPQRYLRLYITKCHMPKVTYIVDGVEMDRFQLQATGYMVNSYWKPRDDSKNIGGSLTLKIESIVGIKARKSASSNA